MPGWDASWGTLHSEIREVGNITVVKLLLYYSLPKKKYIKSILYSYLPVPTSISVTFPVSHLHLLPPSHLQQFLHLVCTQVFSDIIWDVDVLYFQVAFHQLEAVQ